MAFRGHQFEIKIDPLQANSVRGHPFPPALLSKVDPTLRLIRLTPSLVDQSEDRIAANRYTR